MTKPLHLLFPLAALLLSACDSNNNTDSKPTPVPQAQLDAVMKYAAERHSGLIAAKYHMSPQLAQAVISDFQKSQLLLVQVFTSPTPKFETMAQTIERLSATYQLKPDVVASLIIDELLLEHTLDDHSP
jgi:hypothetical protein